MKGTYEERLEIVKEIVEGNTTVRGTAREKGIDKNIVKFWVKLYLYHGEKGLILARRKYTDEEKKEVMEYYKNNDISILDCSAKFLLTNPSTLRKWLREEKKQ